MSGVCLQSQPRRAGHQVLNRLTAPPRQGLNGASLDQLLQGLRHRWLPHLPQLHQLSLGLNRGRIHLRPSQQAFPGRVAQLLLQFRLVALAQREQEILETHWCHIGPCTGEPQQSGHSIPQSLQHPAQITTEQLIKPLHNNTLYGRAPGHGWIKLQGLVAIGQQLLHIPQSQRLKQQRIAEHRAIRQLLDREEIGYTLPETPNSRLEKYQRLGGPNQ